MQTLDDEFTLNIKPKSPTKMLKLGNKSLNSEQCPFDDDWQLINQILDEGIGPSEEKLAINGNYHVSKKKTYKITLP